MESEKKNLSSISRQKRININPQYVERVQDIRKALIKGEQGIISPAEVIQRVHGIVASARLELLGYQDLASLHLGRFFQHYTDKLECVEHKLRARGLVEIVSCSTCKTFANVEVQWCPICGSKLSESTVALV